MHCHAWPNLHLLFTVFLLTVFTPVFYWLQLFAYSSDHIAIGNLVREIPRTHTFISHFSHSELEAIVSAALSM